MKTLGTNTIFASIVASAVASFSGGAEATSNDPVERDMPNPICETFTVKDVSRVPPGHEPSGAELSSLGFTHGSRILSPATTAGLIRHIRAHLRSSALALETESLFV